VLIDPEDGDALEASLVLVGLAQQRLDRLPHRPPARTQLAAYPVDRGMLSTICSIDHRHARVVSFALGAAIRSSCSTNEPTGKPGSGHTQRRFRQMIRTGRPIAGASTSLTSTRP